MKFQYGVTPNEAAKYEGWRSFSVCWTGKGRHQVLQIRFADQHWQVLAYARQIRPKEVYVHVYLRWHAVLYPYQHAALLCAVQQSIDIYCMPGYSSKVCCCGPCWDRQTKRRADARQMHRLCSAYVGNANQWRSQDLEMGGTGGLGNGSPPAGSRGRAPGGWFGGA